MSNSVPNEGRSASPSRRVITFGLFELDLASRELRRQGLKIKLQEQPLKILELLLENAGEIVSRETIRDRIWPADTFVDFDKGLYNAVKKLRDALGDTAGTPRFIETVPKQGYRFISPANFPTAGRPEPLVDSGLPAGDGTHWRGIIRTVPALLALLLIALIVSGRHVLGTSAANSADAAIHGTLSTTVDPADRSLLTYYRGADSNLYQLVWPWDSTRWSQITGPHGRPPVDEGSGMASYVNTISRGPEVFYLAQGSEHVEQISILGLLPTDLTTATGAPPAAKGSSLAGFIDNCAQSDNLFYVGSDQHVHLLTWTLAQGWTTQDLTSLTHSPLAAGTTLSARVTGTGAGAFYFQSDHHLHEFWRWSGCSADVPFDGWHSVDASRMSDVPAAEAAEASPLSGFWENQNQEDADFYVDNHNHLQELFFSGQSVWTNVDVTEVSGSPKVGANAIAAHLNSIRNLEWIYFLDSDRNLRAVTATTDNPKHWSAQFPAPLSQLAGKCLGSGAPAPAAARTSPLVADANSMLNGTEEVFYLGEDNQIYEFEMDRQWSCVNITKMSGALSASR
jgi:DNA-binding winged helix-turn-helix (wHTH) protein